MEKGAVGSVCVCFACKPLLCMFVCETFSCDGLCIHNFITVTCARCNAIFVLIQTTRFYD